MTRRNAAAISLAEKLSPFQVRHEDLGEPLVFIGQAVEHLLAPELGAREQVLGDLGLGDRRAHVLGLVVERLHRDQVDQALELTHRSFGPGPDRDLNGDRMALEQSFFDLVVNALELAADPVHLVDETDPRNPVLGSLPPDRLALGFDTLNGRKDHDGAVQNPQRALDLGREVNVARRIDDVDHQRPAVLRLSSYK